MISIIIPTYNERKNVVILIKDIQRQFKNQNTEIIVVDDNSPDRTFAEVQKIQEKHQNVKLIIRKKERGLTSAIQAGINLASGEYVSWLDADLSHPPKILKKMTNKKTNYDVIIASRYIKGAKDLRKEKLQVVLSWIVNKVANLLLYKNVTDYTSGFIVIKKNVFNNYALQGDYGEYFINLMSFVCKNNYKINEEPFINVSREYGSSKTASNLIGFLKRGRKYIFVIIKNFILK